jgi:two-component system sensor histidine kinase YesM
MRRYGLQHLTFYKKVLLLLLISVYIPVGFIGFSSFSRFSEQLDKVTAAFLSDNLKKNAQRIHELFDEVEQRSVDIYSSEMLQGLLEESKRGHLQEFDYIQEIEKLRYALGGPYDLNIYPSDLNKYPNYNSLRRSMPVQHENWFQQALNSNGLGFWIYETVSDFGTTSADFYYIRPIRRVQSSFETLGVMTIRIPSKLLEERMTSSDQFANYRITVIDDKGDNLLDPESVRFNRSFFSYKGTSKENRNEKFQLIQNQNEAFYADFLPLRYNEWRMAGLIPMSDVTGPIENIRTYIYIVFLLSIIIITSLLAIITNNIAAPIKMVVKQMKKVHQGVLESCQKYLNRQDEIGQLTHGYNSMIKGMRELLEATKQSEQEKRKLEMQMLMNQINPHFLYNTLDAIKWKAETADEKDIAVMVTSLANLLRFSLNEGEEMTTLERELEHVKCYVSIELMRKGNFQVMYHVQPSIMNSPFMKLILQPIVENAILHGMDRLSNEKGKIMISIYREEKDIICEVEDNGSGCEPELIEQLNKLDRPMGKGHGLGLLNVNKRLKISFGPTYGIQVGNSETNGLRVIVRHPLIENSH